MRRHLRLLLPGLLFAVLLSSCEEKTTMNEPFSGTLPSLEIYTGDDSHFTKARPLFLYLRDRSMEVDGSTYDLEVLREEEGQIQYRCDFPVDPEVIVSGILFDKVQETLTLTLAGLDRSVVLESYDRMMARKASEFVEVELNSDLSVLSENQKALLGKLFQVADLMEEIYWMQVFPDWEEAYRAMVNPDVRKFFLINYGPWERLNGNLPFLPGFGPKPAGSGYYPADMTSAEFDALANPEKASLYTLIVRNDKGELEVVPYHLAFASQVEKAAALLQEAAKLADDPGFKRYLELRAEAFLTDDYFPSDMAWMDMKDNLIDFVAGPIENYEDGLYNYKAAHEAFVLLKDKSWSEKLSYINSVLPAMQQSLPVPAEYKSEVPGSDSDLGAYDVLYYAGDCNAGSKTIAINLPNDERVQAAKGSRKLQLKNAIRYKFEEILVPISNVLIAEDQRDHVTFDAFFENTMYHEVAHGLGLNMTVDGSGTVRAALREQYSALEEGKADILGLYLITEMYEKGMLGERELLDNYVTFMASIFRSIRFGVASSHGKANMIRFYYFQELGAFTRDITTGTYRVNFEAMQHAMNELATLILTTQGDGNYELARQLVEEKGFIREELQSDLDRLKELSIPVDITFRQGPGVVGL
ncbi:MAG: Zn-dependent hydrolase [Bacteroidales bacterium]